MSREIQHAYGYLQLENNGVILLSRHEFWVVTELGTGVKSEWNVVSAMTYCIVCSNQHSNIGGLNDREENEDSDG